MITPSSLVSVGLTALTARVAAQEWGYPDHFRPWNSAVQRPWLNYTLTDYFTQQPNATGTFPIAAPDLTRPWEGDEEDVFNNTWSYYSGAWTNHSTTSPRIHNEASILTWLRVPEDSFAEDTIDSGWKVCMWTLELLALSEENAQTIWDSGDDEDVDENCFGVIPEECIAQLKEVTAADRSCFTSLVIDECEGVLDFGLNTVASVTSPFESPGQIDPWIEADNGTAHFRGMKNLDRAQGDEEELREQYDTAITHVIPELIMFKYEDGNGNNRTRSTLTCARTNKVADGSREPETMGDRDSAAEVLRSPVAAGAALAVVAMIMVGA